MENKYGAGIVKGGRQLSGSINKVDSSDSTHNNVNQKPSDNIREINDDPIAYAKELFISKKINSESAAKSISIYLRDLWVNAIRDSNDISFSIEELIYLDKLIFNNIEYLIKVYLEHSLFNFKSSKYIKSLAFSIFDSGLNTINYTIDKEKRETINSFIENIFE